MKLDEFDKIQLTLIGMGFTLLALLWLFMLIFPNTHPGTLPSGGEQFPMIDPAH